MLSDNTIHKPQLTFGVALNSPRNKEDNMIKQIETLITGNTWVVTKGWIISQDFHLCSLDSVEFETKFERNYHLINFLKDGTISMNTASPGIRNFSQFLKVRLESGSWSISEHVIYGERFHFLDLSMRGYIKFPFEDKKFFDYRVSLKINKINIFYMILENKRIYEFNGDMLIDDWKILFN
jgi:hypothetical protein